MRQIIEIVIILGTGLALPFIGNILASMQMGTSPPYLTVTRNISDYLWFIFILEVFNLIPVVLCIFFYCKAYTVLKIRRYIPIGAVYISIIYGHYEMMFTWEDGFAWLIIIVAPFNAIFVFGIALVFTLFVGGVPVHEGLSTDCPGIEK